MDHDWLQKILNEIEINSDDFLLSHDQQLHNLGPKLESYGQLNNQRLWFLDNTLYKNVLNNAKFEQSLEFEMNSDNKDDKQNSYINQ